MSDIKVYKDGTKAHTAIGNIEVLTTAILMIRDRVQYEISYFKDGEHYSKWVEDYELVFDSQQDTNTIGYK